MKPEPVAALALEGEPARRAAFDEVLVASRPRLFRTALLLLGGREEAEDATQRALLRALERRGRFRGDSELYTWLYRILVNVCKDLYKSRSRAARWLGTGQEGAALPDAASPGPSAEQELVAREREDALRRAVARLEPRLREILVLRHYDDMSYEELAGALGCPVGTVRSRLAAARERLRQELLREAAAAAAEGGRG